MFPSVFCAGFCVFFCCRYFAVSGRPDEYAALVRQWSSRGYAGERDMFLSRAVLHTLSCNRYDTHERFRLMKVVEGVPSLAGVVLCCTLCRAG